ncbi:MAG: hypothetical protein ACE5NM_02330 [Sedimentisphaerales bacterium]
MKEPLKKIFILAIGLAIVAGAGCQSTGRLSAEQELSIEKKSRLIAAENIQLKKKLEQRDKEIQKLKKQYDKEIKQLKEELTKCQKQKEILEKRLKKGVKEQVDEVLTAVVEENAKLHKEIKELKTQIEKLKDKNRDKNPVSSVKNPT